MAGNESQGYGSVRLVSAAGRWVLAVAVLGDSMILLEATVVNVALPTIGRNLGAGVAGLQWTLNSYVLTLAALVLVCGSLSDIYGRRRIFILGTVVFVAASALCAAAPTIGLLVAARFVQGIGGALLTPGSLAIIEAVFHPDDRTRAIGAWAGLGAVAGAIGPTVGGYLTDAVSWRAVFLINIPLGIFVVVAAVRHVPETRDPTHAGGLDLRGAALATLAIASVCFALIEASGGLTPAVIAASAIGLAAAVGFVAVERRASHPMLPLELFRSRQFASANLLALVAYVALGGVIFLFVAFLQVTMGYSALQAGAATLPITLLLLTLSTPSGAIAQRIGPRIPLTVGAVLTGAGLLLMAQIHPDDGYLSAVLPSLIVFGVGLGALIAPITATVLASVDSRHSGIASAVNNALSRLGQMIAVAALPLAAGLSGSAFEDPARMAAGFPVAMTVAAGASFAAALLAWTTISNDVLSRSGTDSQQVPKELPPSLKRHCPVAGTPLAASLNSPPRSRPPTAKEP
ncbi:MAG: MFS transporter [Streptosporangiaceae bacterium]